MLSKISGYKKVLMIKLNLCFLKRRWWIAEITRKSGKKSAIVLITDLIENKYLMKISKNLNKILWR